MPDAIPGATYTDKAFGSEMICNGVTTNDDGRDVVVLEYENMAGTINVPLDLFKNDTAIVLEELPE